MYSQNQLEFSWETRGSVHFAGSEHFGKDFFVEIFEKSDKIYIFNVYQENKKIFEHTEKCKDILEAKLKGEEFLFNEMDNFSAKFGYHR